MTKFKKGRGDSQGHKLASERKDLARQIRGTPKQLRQKVHTKQRCNTTKCIWFIRVPAQYSLGLN